LADHLPRKTGRQVLLVSALACVVFAGVSGFIALLVAAVGFFWLRHLMIRRLGGTTGDTAGALLELLEVLVLLAVVVGPA
jgi:adenosylcobinamide-GDP ribazoletransferase